MSRHPLISTLALLLLASVCTAVAAVTPRLDLLGTPIAPQAASHTLQLTQATRYLNVVSGDTVRFVSNGHEFGWSFDVSPIVAVFALNQIAPAGALTREVRVYVTPAAHYSETTGVNRRD